jgi:hypothetical protein
MQYELAKKGQAPRPLDKVTEHFKNIVTQFNPIMMPKIMQDVGTIGVNMGSTIVSPYADILHNVQATGAAGLHRLAGDEQSAQEALNRTRPVTPSGLMREPNLPVVREFEQGLGKAFEASKLPPLGPGSGMPGSAPVSPRPMFTPNDLRVVGAEATRVGRQIGEIPTDFANAQSGLQRIDPVTGQPVLGARIQSGVDRLGDIMEQRRMQGLTPIPGLPAALQPETAMYAVRPQGSRLTTPVVPATARGYSPPVDPANDMFREVTGLQPEQPEVTPTLLHSLNSRVQFNNVPNERNAINGFRQFMETKAKEMYPEAETPRQALEIFNAMHYDTLSRHAAENKIFDEFIQTPEGQQLVPNAVSTDEMAKRHDAATEGLKNMWGKYLVKNLGTEGNPLVKIAAEKGLTQLPAEDVIRVANEEAYAASANRQKAGMPVQGSFAVPIVETKTEVQALNTKIEEAAKRQNELFQAAHLANVDPASIPEYLEARKQVETDTKKRNTLQKKLDNLTLASAYEALEDAAVKPMPAETLLKEMQPSERAFYPGLKESAVRGETSYRSAIGAIENTGFIQAAEKFYNDVLQGKIPADKAATYPVDKYIRENAEARIKVEQAEKAKLAEHKNAVIQSLKDSANALPADKKFGNVGVVELTKDTPVDIANREVAASTEALDICIGEGGSGSGTKNLFTGKKDPRYTPIVNLLTGEPNPNASRHTSGYVTELQRGEQLPMFRDIETGLPIAALQFHTASSMQSNGQPMFNIGYASGAGNGRIEAKYVNGVRDYLNSRANDIAGIGNNLEDNTGIYDTTNRSSLGKARRYAQVSESELKAVDWDSMPRFMTANDIKQAVQGSVPVAPQRSLSLQEDIAQLKATLIDNIETVVNDAVNHSNLVNPEELERRLIGTFSAMQQQSFSTFFDDPIGSMNQSLDLLRDQIDRRSNNASEISQEMVDALDNYAAELEAARDELLAQQHRDLQPAPQAPTRQITEENLRDAMLLNMPVEQVTASSMLSHTFNNNFDAERFRTDPRSVINGAREELLSALQRFEEITDINELRNFGFDDFAERDQWVVEVNDTVDRLNRLEDSLQQPITPAPVPQVAPMQQAEQLLQQIERPLRSTNDGIVNDALQEFARNLQRFASTQMQNGMETVQIASGVRDTMNTLRNMVLTQPTDLTRNFTPDQLGDYVSALRLGIDGIGQWIETQNQQAIATPTANLPAEVQQNIAQRNRQITSAYGSALNPNTAFNATNDALSEFIDLLDNMATNLYGNGLSSAEIVEHLQGRVRSEIMVLSDPNRVASRGLNVAEANTLSNRLNDAYGNLATIHDQLAAPPQAQGDQIARRLVDDSIQAALTPNTGSQAVDAYLSQYSDTLMDQLASYENQGIALPEVITRLRDEIQSHHDLLIRLEQSATETGLTPMESQMVRNRLSSVLGGFPEPMVELNFEPDDMHGANEPYTMQSAVDMARDVFEQERIDANNFDIPSIEQSIYALREGLFDDERIRRLSPRQQVSFSEDVAFRLQNMLDDINARNRPPGRDLVADPERAREAIGSAIQNLVVDYGEDVANRVFEITESISEHYNPGSNLSEYVNQLRRPRNGVRQDVRDGLDHVAEELESVSQERMNLNTAYNTAESYFNELLDDLGSDQRFADLDDDIRSIMVDEQQGALSDRLTGLSDDDFLMVMRRLRENRPIPNEGNRQAVQPVLPAPATAPYRPIPAIIHGMSDQAITADMSEYDRASVQSMFESITDVNSPEELQNIVSLARSYAMGGWDNFSDVQREWLARNIEEYIGDNPPPNTPPPEVDNVFGATGQALRITDRDRELYTELNDMLDNAIEEGYPLPDLGDNEAVARLILNDEVGGDINNATDAERRRLASLVRRYGAHGTLPRGHKKGGRIRKYQDGGSVKGDAAFGVYPGMGKRSKKSDIGDKLNAALIPQDAFDLATTIAPFGKVGKVLAAGILAGDPAEAHAGNMSSLLKLVAREAPEQFQSIRNALLRTFHTGLEHSVVGSTRMGGPSEVMQGATSSVTPNKLDIRAARKNIDQSPLIDFHTHPSQNTSVSDFQIRPSDTDLKYWMGQYGSSYMPQWSNEARVMVGSPPSRQEGVTSAYNFFATDKPAQTLNPAAYEAAKYELQRSKPLQTLKDNPLVGEYLDAGGNMGDLLDSASPLLLQKYFAEKGLGRHEMQLSNRPVTSPSVTEQELFNQIANPAMEVLGSKRFESFAKGGQVHKYQDGGSVSETVDDYGEPNNAALDAFDLMKLERWMSKRPEFHVDSKEFNDDTPDLERDDEVQTPKESVFDAKLKTPWEDDEWVMRNYIRKHYMETFAKGGTVHKNPSVEQMKRELMMRRV